MDSASRPPPGKVPKANDLNTIGEPGLRLHEWESHDLSVHARTT